jgi:hypothetical protein
MMRLTVALVMVATMFAPVRAEDNARQAAQRPYPRSPVIAGIAFDWKTRRDLAPGSDNWPMTWGNDGHQYTSWGDGGGFGGTNGAGRVSLGVARIEGPHNKYRGFNVWGGKSPEHRATFSGKSYGILDVEGMMYMWMRQVDRTHATLAISKDKGATWKKANWDFSPSESFNTATFLQFGPGCSKSRDDYVYSYFIRTQKNFGFVVHKPGRIDLSRVPKKRVFEKDAYEFFAGLDADQMPLWIKDRNARKPVFEHSDGVSWVLSVTYNAGLKRYLLTTEHTKWQSGNIGIYDAPEPWGPWTIVAYDDKFPGWTLTFSNKWTSKDGRDFTAVFTPRDNWATVRGRFALRKVTRKQAPK